jgi:hypothetical protein
MAVKFKAGKILKEKLHPDEGDYPGPRLGARRK